MSARNSHAAKARRRAARTDRKAAFAATRDHAMYGIVNALYRAFWSI